MDKEKRHRLMALMCRVHALGTIVQEKINSLPLIRNLNHLTAQYLTYEHRGVEKVQVPLFNVLRGVLDSLGPLEDGRHVWYEDEFRQQLQDEEKKIPKYLTVTRYIAEIVQALREIKSELMFDILRGRWVDGEFFEWDHNLYQDALDLVQELLDKTLEIKEQLS